MIDNQNLGLSSGLQQPLTDTENQQNSNPKKQPDADSKLIWQRALHSKDAAPLSNPEPIPYVTLITGMQPRVNTEHHEMPAAIQQDLLNILDRILVRDDAHTKEVRISLSDSSFRGLSVRILKDEGRLLFCFICELDTVKRKFDTNAPGLAQQLANRLNQDVLVQVQTNNDNDLRLVEASAIPYK